MHRISRACHGAEIAKERMTEFTIARDQKGKSDVRR